MNHFCVIEFNVRLHRYPNFLYMTHVIVYQHFNTLINRSFFADWMQQYNDSFILTLYLILLFNNMYHI